METNQILEKLSPEEKAIFNQLTSEERLLYKTALTKNDSLTVSKWKEKRNQVNKKNLLVPQIAINGVTGDKNLAKEVLREYSQMMND